MYFQSEAVISKPKFPGKAFLMFFPDHGAMALPILDFFIFLQQNKGSNLEEIAC